MASKEIYKTNTVSIQQGKNDFSVVYETQYLKSVPYSVKGSLQVLCSKPEEIIHHFSNGTYLHSTIIPGSELYNRVVVPEGYTLCNIVMDSEHYPIPSDTSKEDVTRGMGSFFILSLKENEAKAEAHMNEAKNNSPLHKTSVGGINVLVKEVQIPENIKREIRSLNDYELRKLFGDYIL
ncbi:MAG: hypothetical protein ACMXYL_01670 [Candidatus Woesearchaeota archaeon]